MNEKLTVRAGRGHGEGWSPIVVPQTASAGQKQAHTPGPWEYGGAHIVYTVGGWYNSSGQNEQTMFAVDAELVTLAKAMQIVRDKELLFSDIQEGPILRKSSAWRVPA